jgi:hypothetical protein
MRINLWGTIIYGQNLARKGLRRGVVPRADSSPPWDDELVRREAQGQMSQWGCGNSWAMVVSRGSRIHGKFAKAPSTSLLVKLGAWAPARNAGNPVTGSVTGLARYCRFLAGLRAMLPFCIVASKESPARMSSLRRSEPGRTTWPLAETLVCIVKTVLPEFGAVGN